MDSEFLILQKDLADIQEQNPNLSEGVLQDPKQISNYLPKYNSLHGFLNELDQRETLPDEILIPLNELSELHGFHLSNITSHLSKDLVKNLQDAIKKIQNMLFMY